jgi:hypothetical protein
MLARSDNKAQPGCQQRRHRRQRRERRELIWMANQGLRSRGSANPTAIRADHVALFVDALAAFLFSSRRSRRSRRSLPALLAPWLSLVVASRRLCDSPSPLTSTNGPSSIDPQRRADGKFGCVGSEIKDGSRDLFAGPKTAHRMQ